MAELIQFSCPACGTTLRLPMSMAGEQGPCPRCGCGIVAPDPHRGIGGRIDVPPPAILEPLQPFAGHPERPHGMDVAPDAPFQVPATATREEDKAPGEPVTPLVAPVAPPASAHAVASVPRGPQTAVLVLSILLTAVVFLVLGYLLGARSNWLVSRTPFPVMPPVELMEDRIRDLPVPVLPAPAPGPEPVLVKPAIAPGPVAPVEPDLPAPPTPADTKKASAMAEAALKAFLEAPDWAARSAHVLRSEALRPVMETYSRQKPDGPTPYRNIAVENSHMDRKTGYTIFIFSVVTELHPSGFPVAVAETPAGWSVDWESFVEFRDDQFRAFADGPAERGGSFHLVVRQPPAERAANTENEHFSSFLIDPPLPGRQRMAYARKGTDTHAALIRATADGASFWPVLELAKRKAPDGRTFLEITAMKADNWLPETE